jgi:hypothetical protein
MFTVGFLVGAAICAPVFWLLGRHASFDARVSRESADIRPMLRRSS